MSGKDGQTEKRKKMTLTKVKVKEIETSFYQGVKIRLTKREGKFGHPDYGYRLPSGAWGAGPDTKQGALEAAKQAIREGKR